MGGGELWRVVVCANHRGHGCAYVLTGVPTGVPRYNVTSKLTKVVLEKVSRFRIF